MQPQYAAAFSARCNGIALACTSGYRSARRASTAIELEMMQQGRVGRLGWHSARSSAGAAFACTGGRVEDGRGARGGWVSTAGADEPLPG